MCRSQKLSGERVRLCLRRRERGSANREVDVIRPTAVVAVEDDPQRLLRLRVRRPVLVRHGYPHTLVKSRSTSNTLDQPTVFPSAEFLRESGCESLDEGLDDAVTNRLSRLHEPECEFEVLG